MIHPSDEMRPMGPLEFMSGRIPGMYTKTPLRDKQRAQVVIEITQAFFAKTCYCGQGSSFKHRVILVFAMPGWHDHYQLYVVFCVCVYATWI
jgi:hypothetical protein